MLPKYRYNLLFEYTKPSDLNERITHICLGNTIGNFTDQAEIFRIFRRNAEPGDHLVLGFQLDTDIEILFEKYVTNPDFARLILNWDYEKKKNPKLEWKLDKEKGLITAYYDYYKDFPLKAFQSKKYKAEGLSNFVSGFGFKLKKEVIDKDKNACIQVYKKL